MKAHHGLLFSFSYSSVTHGELVEQLKNATAAKVQVGREFLIEKVSMFFTRNTPSKLDMQQ